MKRTFTDADLCRLTDVELRTLFRVVADLMADEPKDSAERNANVVTLKRIGAEISRRRAIAPKP